MKSNVSPEKVYLQPSEIKRLPYQNVFCVGPLADNSIEYIQTKAFIEKACEFFEEYIKEEDCKFGSSEWTELRAEYESLDSFMMAFRNYMKAD